MDKNIKFNKKLWIGLGILVLVILLIFIGCQAFGPKQPVETVPPTTEPQETTLPPETQPTEPEEVPLVMLDWMKEWYERNNAMAGWLRIEGTKIDYPVIHTPEDHDKYLRKDIDDNFSMDGTLFIDGQCSILPESDNIVIYGHNMKKGTMFHDLMKYAKKDFWQEHPIIEYTTLYEEREYEIIAAFYDRVYYTHENVFKFYQFIDYETEEEFANAVENYKAKAEYDTGVEPVFGDRLLTLVTCSYHEENGRFVVVARQITDETAPQETAPVETTPAA